MRARAGEAPLRIVTRGVVAVSLALVPSLLAGGGLGAASAHQRPALGTIVLPAIGFGYTVTSQGPLDASRFPTGSPSASAAAGALSTLGHTIDTYQRSWQDGTGVNQVQDLMVRFPTDAGARAFVNSARRAIGQGQIVSSGTLPPIPGAQRTTYFASTNQAGVGQTITFRMGDYAAVLSFFSGASANPAPITTASAERVAKAQYATVASAADPGTAKKVPGGLSAAVAGWAVLALALLAAAVVALFVRRRRRDSD
jgi:hypothetical protein